MKRLLILSLTLVAAGLLCQGGGAQEVVVNAKAAQAAPPAVQAVTEAATGTHLGHGADCGARKVCVSVPDVIKHSKVVYGCKTKEYCLKGPCGSCDGSCGDCDRCGPRTRRVLLKKVVTSESPGYKCEVADEPVCVSDRCPVRCGPRCCTGKADACETVVPAAPPAPGKKMPPTTTISTPPAAATGLDASIAQPLPAGSSR